MVQWISKNREDEVPQIEPKKTLNLKEEGKIISEKKRNAQMKIISEMG